MYENFIWVTSLILNIVLALVIRRHKRRGLYSFFVFAALRTICLMACPAEAYIATYYDLYTVQWVFIGMVLFECFQDVVPSFRVLPRDLIGLTAVLTVLGTCFAFVLLRWPSEYPIASAVMARTANRSVTALLCFACVTFVALVRVLNIPAPRVTIGTIYGFLLVSSVSVLTLLYPAANFGLWFRLSSYISTSAYVASQILWLYAGWHIPKPIPVPSREQFQKALFAVKFRPPTSRFADSYTTTSCDCRECMAGVGYGKEKAKGY